MTAAEIHREALRRLLALRGTTAARIRLVARLNDPVLLGGASARRTFFFVPDLHLVSRAAEPDYQYTFFRLDLRRTIRRDLLLDAVCQAMLELWNRLPDGQSLKTVQLGDFVDLWRENEHAPDDVQTLVSRILDDNPVARRRLIRKREPSSLEADLLLGNHDLKMDASSELNRASRGIVYAVDGKRSLLVTHGDLFDDLERLTPDELAEWFVERFARHVPPNGYPVDRSVEAPTSPVSRPEGGPPLVLDDLAAGDALPDRVNIWVAETRVSTGDLAKAHKLLPKAVEYARGLRAGQRRYLSRLDLTDTALGDLRAIVIGHSHCPRICVYDDPGDSSDDLVLLDCGAWIEDSRFGERVPSCHIGILSGGDARIYQIDPHPSLITRLH